MKMTAGRSLLAVVCLFSVCAFAQTTATPSAALPVSASAGAVQAPTLEVAAFSADTIPHMLALTMTPPLPQSSTPPDAPEPEPDHRHILGIIPSYDVTVATNTRTLTSRQKFNLFVDDAFDRFTLISAAADAGINQATDTPRHYGQGGEGFAKRYGSAIGDKLASDFFKLYMFPSLFKQDPRYFVLGEGTKGHRIGYAISRVFVTRTDAGNKAFNLSEIIGTGASAGIVNAWYPEEDRDVQDTLARWGTRVAVDAAANVFKEFWPGIKKKMRRKKQ